MGKDYKPTGNPVGRPNSFKQEYCQMVIDHMKTGMSFWSFGAVINVSMDTLSEWTKKFPEFAEAKRTGKSHELRIWESIKQKAAMGMQIEIPGYKGKLKDPNSTLIIFSMKNKFPSLYRDRVNIEGSVELSSSGIDLLSENEKAKILQAALEAKLNKLKSEKNESNGE